MFNDSVSYIAERVVDNFPSSSPQLLNCLLITAIKLFLSRPAENQEFLGRVFEMCFASTDIDVRDRLLFYYRLLHTDNPNLSITSDLVVLSTAH